MSTSIIKLRGYKMKILILSILLMSCSTPRLHKDVEVGNEATTMMQCKVLCDSPEKVYGYSKSDLNCQCQRPVERGPAANYSPVLKFQVNDSSDEAIRKGVMSQLLNGKMLISTVKGE